ncbi:hypothetical protein DFQ28_001112, partial [Apophysomyces sp. BC1034]
MGTLFRHLSQHLYECETKPRKWLFSTLSQASVIQNHRASEAVNLADRIQVHQLDQAKGKRK